MKIPANYILLLAMVLVSCGSHDSHKIEEDVSHTQKVLEVTLNKLLYDVTVMYSLSFMKQRSGELDTNRWKLNKNCFSIASTYSQDTSGVYLDDYDEVFLEFEDSIYSWDEGSFISDVRSFEIFVPEQKEITEEMLEKVLKENKGLDVSINKDMDVKSNCFKIYFTIPQRTKNSIYQEVIITLDGQEREKTQINLILDRQSLALRTYTVRF